MFEPGRVGYDKVVIATGVGGACAALGNVGVFLAAKHLFAVSFLMPVASGVAELAPLTLNDVLLASALPALGAAIFLALMDKLVERPFLAFFAVSVALLVFSIAFPVSLPDTVSFGTKIALECMHLVAGAAIIGAFMKLARAGDGDGPADGPAGQGEG